MRNPRLLQACLIASLASTASAGGPGITVLPRPSGALPNGSSLCELQAISRDGTTAAGFSDDGAAGVQATYWKTLSGLVAMGAPGNPPVPHSAGFGVSGNGAYIVGANGSHAFEWHLAYKDISGPTKGVIFTQAKAANTDGSVVVGVANNAGIGVAAKWTPAAGVATLTGKTQGQANTVNADGSVIAGAVKSGAYLVPAEWTNGTQTLLGLPSGYVQGRVDGISSDASILVGEVSNAAGTVQHATEWYRGRYRLLDLGSAKTEALATSDNGYVIVGSNGSSAALWTAQNGEQPLASYLNGIGVSTADVALGVMRGVSADGTVIVGVGTTSDGLTHSVVVKIVLPPTLSALSVPATIASGKATNATVTLTGITTVAVTDYPYSSSKAAMVPATGQIAAGKSAGTFSIQAATVTADTSVTISVFYFTGSKSQTTIVKAPVYPVYTIQVITPFVNGSYTQPAGLNDKGQVVGTGDTTNYAVHGWFFDPASGKIDIGIYAPTDINNSSFVVGGYPKVSIYQTNIFYWTKGAGAVDPGLPHDTNNSSNPTVLNNGAIFGNAGPTGSAYISQPYQYYLGKFTNPDSGSSAWTEFLFSNHFGYVFGEGWANNPPNILKYSWMISNGVYSQFPATYFTARHFYPQALGDEGTILGRISTNLHAAICKNGVVTDLGIPGSPLAMNMSGQVLIDDYNSSNGPYGYLWTKATGAVDIDLFLPKNSGFTIGAVNRINSKGQITCSAYSTKYHSSLGVALLLTPP